MKINYNLKKINIQTLSNLNIILLFIGVQFVTSFFLVGVEDPTLSRSVTLPFRFLVLVLSMYIIFFTKKSAIIDRIFFFWVLFLIVFTIIICWDIFTGKVIPIDKNQILMFIFLINFPLVFSLQSSLMHIDFDKVLKYVYYLSIFTTLFIIFTNPSVFSISNMIEERVSGSVAFSTISFGHFCSTISLLAINNFFYRDKNKLQLLTSFLIFLFGMFCMIKSGSRGPIFSMIFIGTFVYLIKSKNIVSFFKKIILVSISIFSLINLFLIVLKNISPYLEQRLRVSIENGDLGGRQSYYDIAFEYISNNLFFGKQFLLKFNEYDYFYAHNIFLDILIASGIFGLLFFLVIMIKVFKNINYIFKNEKSYIWLCLIFLQYFTFHFLSGAFYMDPIFIGTTTLLILLNEKYFTNIKSVS